MTQPALFKPFVVHMTLKGHCPSKKNLWKRGRGGHVYIDQEVRVQILNLTTQAGVQWNRAGHDDPCIHPDMQVQFFVRDQKPDRDNKLTTILDCLREAGVIQNDNIKHFNGVLTLWPAEIADNERVDLVLSFHYHSRKK